MKLEMLLADSLSRVDPDISIRVHGAGERPGMFKATIQSVETDVAWLATGWPRQVHELLDRQVNPGLVIARELSPGARKLLTAHHLSWVDGTGAARVALPGLYVRVDVGRVTEARSTQPGWTPATLAVSEALMVGIGGTVAELKVATGLAPSTVAKSLRFLQSAGLLSSKAARGRNSRRVVIDHGQLLDTYAAAAAALRSPTSVRVGILWRNPSRGASTLGSMLEAKGVAWSVTGALAADTLAPYLTEVDPWELYIDGDSLAEIRQIAREVGLEASDGGRLLLRPFPTPAKDALSTEAGGQRIATWPRVFSDLRMIGVRGEEAAEHLRDRVGAKE